MKDEAGHQACSETMTVLPPRNGTRVRAIAHEPIPPGPSMPAMDLLVAGFAIVGALLISFLR
jgi:hypothetical protein